MLSFLSQEININVLNRDCYKKIRILAIVARSFSLIIDQQMALKLFNFKQIDVIYDIIVNTSKIKPNFNSLKRKTFLERV